MRQIMDIAGSLLFGSVSFLVYWAGGGDFQRGPDLGFAVALFFGTAAVVWTVINITRCT